MTAANYRPDIDGLRAIAVSLVVAFHSFPSGLPGGFVGVDVFFVISGFLITGIILDQLDRGFFSISQFYARRVRRILPMLIVITLASGAAGYILLYPGDYRAFGLSAIAALLAWSNIFFLHHTGYFDVPSQTMPLLHTWSLGVEEQFYLVWPGLLLAGSKLFGTSRRTWRFVFLIVILLSFTIAVILTGREPKASFYLPFTRAWELALGAILATIPPASVFLPRPISDLLPVIGLGSIAVAAATFSSAEPFPGFSALLPTVGAAMVICPAEGLTRAVLGTAPLRIIGLMSYSLYLWHWPIIAFWRTYNHGLGPTGPASLAIIAASVVLSAASWRFIELPARRINASTLTVIGSAIAGSAISLILISSIVLNKGFPNRLPLEVASLDGKDRMWEWTCPQSVAVGVLTNGVMTSAPSCAYGSDWRTARRHALIWGDSLSQHLAPELDLVGQETGTAIAEAYACAAITQPGAPRNLGADLTPHYENWCDAARDRVLSLITSPNQIDTVLLSTSWSFLWPLLDPLSEAHAHDILKSGLNELLERIIAAGKRPIVIADVPAAFGPDPASCVMALIGLPRTPCRVDPAHIDIATIRSQAVTHSLIKQIVALHPGALVIDPMDFLCDATRCQKFINDELIYRDTVHLRRNLKPATVAALAAGLKLKDALDPP